MENSRTVNRTEIWQKIFQIVKKIPRQDIESDAPDAPSISCELEEYFKEQLLLAYKDGFDSATESLIAANNMVQKRKF